MCCVVVVVVVAVVQVLSLKSQSSSCLEHRRRYVHAGFFPFLGTVFFLLSFFLSEKKSPQSFCDLQLPHTHTHTYDDDDDDDVESGAIAAALQQKNDVLFMTNGGTLLSRCTTI